MSEIESPLNLSTTTATTPSYATTNDPTLVWYQPEFAAVIGENYSYSTLVEVNAHEGPVYFRETNELYFTTVPNSTNIPIQGYKQIAIQKVCLSDNNRIETIQERSNNANGMTMDLEQNLLICEQGSLSTPATISKFNRNTGIIEPLVDNWFNLPFNSPNDVIVKQSDGSIWFTDPAYGYAQGFKNPPLIGNYVYRFDPTTNQARVVADSFIRPNGLAFSPDQTKIYINDSAADLGDGSPYQVDLPHHIKVFDILEDGFLANERLFAVVTPGIPDGLKVDTTGRVYSSSASGVQVFNDKGVILGEVLAEGVANFTFGGPNNNILYICKDDAILEVQIAAVGAGDYDGF